MFAAAGDLIGASTFESFIQQGQADHRRPQRGGSRRVVGGQPRVRQGLDDLVNRVMAAYDADDQPAGWCRVAVPRGQREGQDDRRAPTSSRRRGRRPWQRRRGGLRRCGDRAPAGAGVARRHRRHRGHRHRRRGQRGGRRPQGRAGRHHRDARPRGRRRRRLRRRWTTTRRPTSAPSSPASTTTSTRSSPATPTWSTTAPSRWRAGPVVAVTERPVVSAGQYGTALNQIVFTVDPTTDEVTGKSQAVLRLKNGVTGSHVQLPVRPGHGCDRRGRGRRAAVAGRRAAGPDRRTVLPGQVRRRHPENRGGESTLGNLVAEVQRWATQNPESGSRADRVHEPGRPACRTCSGSATRRPLPAHAHLPAGGRRPAVRQHPGEHGPDGRPDQGGARAAVAARRRAVAVRSCGSVPRRASSTPTTRAGRRPRHEDVARTARRSTRRRRTPSR